jgi:hypothetical protein
VDQRGHGIQLSGIGPVEMTYLDPPDDPRKNQ